METLEGAVKQGYFWHMDRLLQEPDLKPLHGSPRFERIVNKSEGLRQKAQLHAKPLLKVLYPRAKRDGYPLMVTLHGRGGNATEHAERWRSLTAQGVLTAFPQSSQVFDKGGYCWDDEAIAERELGGAVAKLMRTHRVDPEKFVMGGFSQGGTLALKLALEQKPARTKGFVAVVPALRGKMDSLMPLIDGAAERGLRGYLFTGERDFARSAVEQFHKEARAIELSCGLSVEKNLGHDYPNDFGPKLASAVKFVLA
ncbi:MAG: hypothetical protein JRM82_04070 [Nitrososphaerota archaeon]|nr:hypothetical protein [Nitrososphaerota archaeon]